MAAETVRRAVDSGWGDGLEVLAFLVPVGLLVAGGLAVAVSVLVRTVRISRAAPPTPSPPRASP